LVITIPLLHLAGTTFGAMGIDINVTKSTDIFIYELAGPVIGMMVASWFKIVDPKPRRTINLKLAAAVVLLVCLNNISGIGRSDGVKRARISDVPTWKTDMAQMNDAKGSVFLLGHWQFPSFYPVYSFYSHNEHYAHPASQYFARYRFLALLSEFDDPLLFNVALNHNRFDRVDYFMPHNTDDKYGLTVSFSNYPDRSYAKELLYDKRCVEDTVLFTRQEGINLFKVNESGDVVKMNNPFTPESSANDSLLIQYRAWQIWRDLDSTGKDYYESILHIRDFNWIDIGPKKRIYKYSDEVQLTNAALIERPDSLGVIFTFVCLGKLKEGYRVLLELRDGEKVRDTFVIVPEINSSEWEKPGLIHCMRMIPNQPQKFDIAVGLFADTVSLSAPYEVTVNMAGK
jgi:hypothetical protein